jgi:hypothetical protein
MAPGITEAMAISPVMAADGACDVDLRVDAAEPAAGSIATDRAITKAIIVRSKRIAAFSTTPTYRMCAYHRQVTIKRAISASTLPYNSLAYARGTALPLTFVAIRKAP